MDDAGRVSRSLDGRARMMAVVMACQEFGLTVSMGMMEPMLLWSVVGSSKKALHISAGDQRFN